MIFGGILDVKCRKNGLFFNVSAFLIHLATPRTTKMIKVTLRRGDSLYEPTFSVYPFNCITLALF
jgi:hypothetical protein